MEMVSGRVTRGSDLRHGVSVARHTNTATRDFGGPGRFAMNHFPIIVHLRSMDRFRVGPNHTEVDNAHNRYREMTGLDFGHWRGQALVASGG